MTEKDPIELLRKCLKYEDTLDLLREKLGVDFRPGWTHACLDKFADEIEAQYMRLPMDADGVPIRPGDLIESDYTHGPMTVANVGKFDVYAYNECKKGFFVAEVCHHAKPDTVESLLKDMMKAIAAEHVIFVPVDKTDEFNTRLRNIRDDYAERIRKAVECDSCGKTYEVEVNDDD